MEIEIKYLILEDSPFYATTIPNWTKPITLTINQKRIIDFTISSYLFKNMKFILNTRKFHNEYFKLNNTEDKELKETSDETLTKIIDTTCEWMTEKKITSLADRYQIHLKNGIIEPPQLKGTTNEDIKNDISLKLAQFIYNQFSQFKTNRSKGNNL
ncbi:hypothetical protein RFI_25563 [Reticulomyxa filosa]|uniref:Uncharacterized protein n=1 Tax=Reticulomyxa filosa TaxID=46433 RepID=X6MCS6_RETFI|nr:hypothetical protein RFI_25563 [Reticulomyxa filosa]|eukprot:ETO11813.1 hypothetical protein RFI_25563 [Reticulomyxa filosa]